MQNNSEATPAAIAPGMTNIMRLSTVSVIAIDAVSAARVSLSEALKESEPGSEQQLQHGREIAKKERENNRNRDSCDRTP